MSVLTLEAIVEDGEIRLRDPIRLPEHTTVYVIVPGIEEQRSARIASPRLVNPEQARDFEIEILDASNVKG